MKTYEEKRFNIPELKGISQKTIEEHLKLYAGYVKNTNAILQKIEEMETDKEKNSYAIAEVRRRLGFEFDGMRNHEHYFPLFEGGAKALPAVSLLRKAIETEFESFEKWLETFSGIAMTRGIGWAILYFDSQENRLVNAWVDEHHLGQLTGLSVVIPVDMFEHAYMLDYPPSEKKKYVDAFFDNINWEIAEANFIKASK